MMNTIDGQHITLENLESFEKIVFKIPKWVKVILAIFGIGIIIVLIKLAVKSTEIEDLSKKNKKLEEELNTAKNILTNERRRFSLQVLS